MGEKGFFRYDLPARCFLERARGLIERFDNGETECFIYAALELRMGIESRLYYYIESALRTAKQPPERIKEYSASKLLAILAKIDPQAGSPVTLIIREERSGSATALEYTPVTPLLASYRGMLGELLHFKFFKNNTAWFKKTRSKSHEKRQTMYDHRDFLVDVSQELSKVVRGSLGAPPVFLSQMDQLSTAEE